MLRDGGGQFGKDLGAPEIDDDYALFINAGIDLTDSQQL